MRALSTVQPFTALPSTVTAHAPHCARSQPRFEFERPSWKFIVSQRLSRLSTMTSRLTPSMSRVTRRMVGPSCVAVLVVVAAGGGLIALVATAAPPSTAPAAAAPAPAPMRKLLRVRLNLGSEIDFGSAWVGVGPPASPIGSPPAFG